MLFIPESQEGDQVCGPESPMKGVKFSKDKVGEALEIQASVWPLADLTSTTILMKKFGISLLRLL